MELIDTLTQLAALPGPTGREAAVMDWLRGAWESRVERLWSTKVGNLLARVGGSGPRLLIQAHADELSFVVRSIDERGFLWLASGQRSDEPGKRFPIGQPALVLGRSEPVEGLFATPTGHVLTEAQRQKHRVEYGDFFIDLGLNSRQEVLDRGIHVGAAVIWNPPLRRLGQRIYGKAMDDRMLLALMTVLLDRLDHSTLTYDLYLAATIQEEIGLLGAHSLQTEVDADLAIALDVGLVGDIPGVSEQEMPTGLGRGPLVIHKDASTHYSQSVIQRLVAVAERQAIPIQHAVLPNFGSDGAELIRRGIPTALLAPGTRYTHSPFEMVDERDLWWTIDLLEAFVTTATS